METRPGSRWTFGPQRIIDLDASIEPLGIHSGGRSEGPLIGLVGRDFLKHTKFTYDGVRGAYQIEVDVDSLRPLPPDGVIG